MTINGNPDTGEFNAVDPIPVTFNAEHVLSATIEFGDMKITYSVKEDKFDESCFDGTNNKVTITNSSTCDIGARFKLSIGETYSEALDSVNFRLTYENKNGSLQSYDIISEDSFLSPGRHDENGVQYPINAYLTVAKDSNIETMHGYNFNNAKIGEITIELKPVFDGNQQP